MKTIIDWATHHPIIEKLSLAVFSNNTRAIHLYKKFGFKKEGQEINKVKIDTDNYVDNILMCKFIK